MRPIFWSHRLAATWVARPLGPAPGHTIPRRAGRLGPVLWGLLLALLGCTPAAPPPLDLPEPRHESTVRLAGDALATPLAEILARTFRDRVRGPALVVEPPLAGAGAQRALAAGALDAVLLVLPADAPAPPNGERIARTRPLWVAGAGLRTRHLSPSELALGLRGRLRAADGQPIRFQLGPPGDPRLAAFARNAPEVQAALVQPPAGELDRGGEADVRSALRPSPQHIGLADTGLLALFGTPVWPIRYGAPVVPLDLWVVHGGAPPPQLQAFLAFLRAPAGREQVADLGYDLPPAGAP